MKHSLLMVGVAGALALTTLGAQAQDNHQAQAGLRIGRVFIGDTRAAVARRLGPPTRSFTLGSGLTSQLWRGKKASDLGNRNTLEVVYRNGVVSQIEATSLVFKTPSNLSLSSSRAQWERVYGKPLIRTYEYDDGTRKRYLDWRRSGIAVELVSAPRDTEGSPDNWIYQTLIVHRKSTSVVPDAGGTLQ